MVLEIKDCNPKAIWAEPINPRGNNILNCIRALRYEEQHEIANAFDRIRNRQEHKQYTYNLINMMTDVFKKNDMDNLLKILVYSKGDGFIGDDSSVIWLKR